MLDHRNPFPGDDDLRDQSAVLGLILAEHPTLFTQAEIEREVGAGDATHRALRDLTAAGLLRQEGGTVFPTRAALHFDRLPR
jgi:DNA-binding IclR family transcriptional regulator